jgi:hypothetical protein
MKQIMGDQHKIPLADFIKLISDEVFTFTAAEIIELECVMIVHMGHRRFADGFFDIKIGDRIVRHLRHGFASFPLPWLLLLYTRQKKNTS